MTDSDPSPELAALRDRNARLAEELADALARETEVRRQLHALIAAIQIAVVGVHPGNEN